MLYQPLKKKTCAMAMVYMYIGYIELNDGGITDEDSADEDEEGLVNNLSGNQLNVVAEAVKLMEDI